MSFQYREKKDSGPRTNEQITASEVRVISSSGKQLGIISIREALNHAEDEGFDLVEVSPDAKPPVCEILDYGKLKYREQKSKKEAKKKQKTIEIKPRYSVFLPKDSKSLIKFFAYVDFNIFCPALSVPII